MLESSVTIEDERLRAHFQLIDGATGNHVWAQRFDRTIETLMDLSDEIATDVANALGGFQGEIQRAELRLVKRKTTANLTAYEHFILAREHEHIFDADNTRKGLDHIDLSIAADPAFARSWLVRRFLLERAADLCSEIDSKACRRDSDEAIRRAYALDPRDGLVLLETGFARAVEWDQYGAMDVISRAADLGRNQPDVSALAATTYAMIVGDMEEARSLLGTALRLNPAPPRWYRFSEARVAFFSGDFIRCEQVSMASPGFVATLSYQSLSQAMLGKANAAKASHAALNELAPNFDFENHAKTFPIVAENALARYRAAVEKLSALV